MDLSACPVSTATLKQTLSRIRNHLSTDTAVHGSYLALGKDSGGKVRIDLELQDTKAGAMLYVFCRLGLKGLISRTRRCEPETASLESVKFRRATAGQVNVSAVHSIQC